MRRKLVSCQACGRLIVLLIEGNKTYSHLCNDHQDWLPECDLNGNKNPIKTVCRKEGYYPVMARNP